MFSTLLVGMPLVCESFFFKSDCNWRLAPFKSVFEIFYIVKHLSPGTEYKFSVRPIFKKTFGVAQHISMSTKGIQIQDLREIVTEILVFDGF